MKNFLAFLFVLPFCMKAQNADSLIVVRELDSLIQACRDWVQKQNLSEALTVIEAAEKKAMEVFGEDHASSATVFFNRGRVLYYMGKYPEAEHYYRRSADIRAKVLSKENADYAWSLNNLGVLYFDTGKYAEAESLYLEAKAIREKVLGKEHRDYGASLTTLANLYKFTGRYEQAEPFYTEANKIWAITPGKEHPFYAGSLNNLAFLYHTMAEYEKAEPLYLESKAIRERTIGKKNADYAQSLNNLAILYLDMGEYEKAEPFYLEARSLREAASGKEHPDYAKILNDLGNLYWAIGNHDQAEALYSEAISIREKVLGKEHKDYACTLSNLGNLFKDTKSYEKAEKLYIESQSIQEKALGKENPDYALYLRNLGDLYFNMEKYGKCEPLYRESKNILEKASGKEHPHYAACLTSLANLSVRTGDYEQAEQFYQEALAIQEKILGKAHPDYQRSLERLMYLYVETGDDDKASSRLLELSPLNQSLIAKGANHLSENELSKFIRKNAERSDGFLSFTGFRKNTDPALVASAWDNALFSKGFLLENTRALERIMATAPDSLRDIHSRWRALQRRLAAEYARPVAERQNVSGLESRADSLEKILVRSIAGFADNRRNMNWREVQAKLQAGSAAVEFIHYQYYNPKGKATDSILYVALVLKADSPAPRWIPLFEQKQLDSLLRTEEGRKAEYANRLYASGSALYDLIWKHLEPALASSSNAGTPEEEGVVRTVFFSSTGALHRINFDAVPVGPGNGILADRYKLVQVGSTRNLVEPPNIAVTNNDAMLFGGIRYEADSAALSQSLSALLPAGTSVAMRGALTFDAVFDSTFRNGYLRELGNEGNWAFLPFTEREVSGIETILANNRLKPLVRSGVAATEESFKRMGQGGASPRVLHVATHGFFFPDVSLMNPSKTGKAENAAPAGGNWEGRGGAGATVFKISDNPMMRAGLILAGANRVWKGRPQIENLEDGILTAYEISQMNLSNTELVVLSACETGLGDIRGNEGVYGLQRAFKIAGARYVIMSMWQVPDKQTSQLMTTFYRNWLEEKMTIPEAFRAAQKEMRDLGLEPFKWAGFVLVE